MSTPINEAYARIDVSTILDLQNRVADLERVMPTEAITKLRNEKYNIKRTRIFAKSFRINKNSGNTLKVSFGSGFFDSLPIVSATVYDPTFAKGNIEEATLTMYDITKNSIKIDINRKTKGVIMVHVIAIGAGK